MATIYFLVSVAALGVAMVWLVRHSIRRNRHGRSRQHTVPLHLRQMDGHSVAGEHAGHLPSQSRAVWRAARANSLQRRHPAPAVRPLAAMPTEPGDDSLEDSIVMNVVECGPEDLNLDNIKPPPKYQRR